MININKLKYTVEYYKEPILGLINTLEPNMYNKLVPQVLAVRRYDLDLGCVFDYNDYDDKQGAVLVDELYLQQRAFELKMAAAEWIRERWPQDPDEWFNMKNIRPYNLCVLSCGELITEQEAREIMTGKVTTNF